MKDKIMSNYESPDDQTFFKGLKVILFQNDVKTKEFAKTFEKHGKLTFLDPPAD